MFAKGWMHRWIIRRAGRRLQLRPGQKEKLDMLVVVAQSAHAEMKQLHRGWHEILGEALTADDFDRRQALQLATIPQRALEDQLVPVVDSFGQFYDSLDREQRQRLIQWWQKTRYCFHGRGHRYC